jgi:gliding motility-associated-like protein
MAPPVVTLTPLGTSAICLGESLQLASSGASSFVWSNGQTGSSIIVSFEGTYWVAASNACGNDTAFIFVDVDSVTAFYTASTTFGQYPLEVDFMNNSSESAVQFQWEYGDGNVSGTVQGSNTYQSPGTYTAILTATNANGCTDRYETTIIVQGDASFIAMPNIFSPNGDGINDEFAVIGESIEKFNCKIYDRWGIMMVELTSINGKWDGRTTSGNIASDGTYFYVLKADGTDEKKYELKGFVELVGK